jgi:hypothetical protein
MVVYDFIDYAEYVPNAKDKHKHDAFAGGRARFQ